MFLHTSIEEVRLYFTIFNITNEKRENIYVRYSIDQINSILINIQESKFLSVIYLPEK